MANNTTVKLSIVDAVFKYGTYNTVTLPAGTQDKSVADVSLKVTAGEGKANTRMSRHEQSLPSMFATEVEVSIPSDSASGSLTALMTAFTNAYPIPVYVGDGTGVLGMNFVAAVMSWDDTETLNDVPMHKFTLKPYAVGQSGTFPYFS